MPELISETLRKAIQASGITPYELAKRANVSPQSITRFLKGERSLSLEVIDKVCHVLGLELESRNGGGLGGGDG